MKNAENGESAPSQRGTSLPALLLIACAIIVISALKLAGGLLVPILFGIFLAIVSFPVMNWLERRRFPHILALILTVVLNIAVFVGVVSIGGELYRTFRAELVPLADRVADQMVTLLEESKRDIEEKLKSIESLVGEETEEGSEAPSSGEVAIVPVEAPDPVASSPVEPRGLKEAIVEWAKGLDGADLESGILGNVGSVFGKIAGPLVGKIASSFSTSVFVLIVMIFSLHEGRAFQGKIRGIRRAQGPDFSRFMGAATDIQRYLRIKTMASILTGILAGALCALLDIKYAVLWGLVAFLLNFIPVVGSIFAGIVPVLIAIVDHSYLRGAGIATGYLLINFTIGNFLEPSLLGRRFGLSTLVIILSVFFWGWMWGPLGMFLAVPLTMMAKVVFDNSDDFRWLSLAMGKGGKRRRRKQRESDGEEFEEAPEATDALAREPAP